MIAFICDCACACSAPVVGEGEVCALCANGECVYDEELEDDE